MPNVGTVSIEGRLDLAKARQEFRRFEQEIARSSRLSGLGRISHDARDFEKSLGAATNRVVAFGAAAVVFEGLRRSLSAFANSIVEVDQYLTRINVNLNQSADGLKKFSTDLFNISRQTGQTFEVAAKAAEELARQGLSAEETTKRLKDSLILSRIAGLDSAEAVETLTAAINSFGKEALTSTEIINKFAAVDTQFAVSSKDLAEAVSRVGSTAQSAGVNLNELVGLVTSLQQTTARGGAVIGNALKTIFTRIQAAPETVNALQSVGVAIKDTSGNLRSAIDILKDYGIARERLGEVERASLDRTIAGTYQINILKATLADLGKQYSVYNNALGVSSNATDEAIRKNEQLNQTLSSLINQTSVSIKQLFSSIGEQELTGTFKGLAKGLESTRSFLSGEGGSELGQALGSGMLKGVSNVLSGPGVLTAAFVLYKAFSKVFSTIRGDIKSLFDITNVANKRAVVQEKINTLLAQATTLEREEFFISGNILAQREKLLAIERRINQEKLAGSALARSFVGQGALGIPEIDPRLTRGRKSLSQKIFGNFADPLQSAIRREMAAGVPRNQIYVDKDPRVANFANPEGILIANKRDEPLGGFQGVNRVIAQGGNPKTAGIPNFAPQPILSQQELVLRRLGLTKTYEGKAPTAISLAMSETSGAVQEFKKLEKTLKLVDKAFERLSKERATSLSEKLKLIDKGFENFRIQLYGLKQYLEPIGPSRPNIKIISDQSRYSPYQLPTISGGTVGERYRIPGTEGTFRDVPYQPFGVSSSLLGSTRKKFTREDYRKEVVERQRRRESLIIRGGIEREEAIIEQNTRLVGLQEELRRNAATVEQKKIDARFAASQNRRRGKIADLERLRQGRQNRALAASFILPFAGGFVEPVAQSLGYKTGGGTAGGITTGALSGAATGAGLLGIFGPAGLAVGAALGGLAGAFGKLKKSAEEYGQEVEVSVAQRASERDAIGQYLSIQEQLNEALKEGAGKDILSRLRGRLTEAGARVTSVSGRAIIRESDPEKRAQLEEQDRIQRAQKDSFERIAQTLREGKTVKPSDFQGITEDFVKSLTAENRSALRTAAGGSFEIPKLVYDRETRQSNIEEVKRAQDKFKKAIEDVTPVIGQFIDVAQLTPENLNQITAQFTKALLNIKQAAQEAAKGTPFRGLAPNTFTSQANLDIFRQAALTGRSPFASPGQRARSQFDAFQELTRLGVRVPESVSQKARVGTQRENVLEAAVAVLQSAYPSEYTGRLVSGKGRYNVSAIQRLLAQGVRGGGRNAAFFQQLLPLVESAQLGAKDLGIDQPLYTEGVTGITPGVKYSTYAGRFSGAKNVITKANIASKVPASKADFITKENIAGRLPSERPFDLIQEAQKVTDQATKNIQALTEKAVQIQVNIDGALNLISQGMDARMAVLIKGEVNKAIISATSQYFEQVGKDLGQFNSRISILEGKPVPPSTNKQNLSNVSSPIAPSNIPAFPIPE